MWNAVRFTVATTLCSTALGIDTRSQQEQQSLAFPTNSTTITSNVANVTSGAIESTMDILLRFLRINGLSLSKMTKNLLLTSLLCL